MIQRILNFFGRNKRKYPNSPVVGSQTGKINSNKSIADAATTAEEAIHKNNSSTKWLNAFIMIIGCLWMNNSFPGIVGL
jgi:hypothetical protein